jgi:hypothetical protein
LVVTGLDRFFDRLTHLLQGKYLTIIGHGMVKLEIRSVINKAWAFII